MSVVTEEPAAVETDAAATDAGAPEAGAARPWWRAPWLVALAGLALLVVASLYLRTQAITAKFWIDEGLSVGIAHHGFFDIPSVLRQDG